MSYKMNMTQLNEYLWKIIQVVNQHGKLLHRLNHEIQFRVTERQLGEVFSVISSGLQYGKFLKLNQGEAPRRRDSVKKHLTSILQPDGSLF